MTTGQRIKEARKKAGLTQKELGAKLGITYQTLAQWENDLRNPKIETLQRIAAALGIPVSALVGSSDELQAEVLKKLQETKGHLSAADQAEGSWQQRVEQMNALEAYIAAQNAAKKKNAVDVQERENRKQKLVSVYDELNGSCQEKVLGYAEGLAEDEDNLVKHVSLPSPFQAPPEDTDTTPPKSPSEGAETPPEGKK